MLILLGLVIAAPPIDQAAADKAVKDIRSEYQSVSNAMKSNALRVARFRLGGGQNPTEFEVAYQAVGEREIERDPYASVFRLRRLTQHKILPAVGDASVELTFTKEGKLLFAYCVGVDISGAGWFNDMPTSHTRVYFADDESVFRVVTTNGDGDRTLAVINGSAKEKQMLRDTGVALVKHASTLKSALDTLSR